LVGDLQQKEPMEQDSANSFSFFWLTKLPEGQTSSFSGKELHNLIV